MPIKYVPFVPEPIEGQAVLKNFNRILKYKGADDTSMVLERGMPLYEVEKLETVGENKNNNMVIRGECVSACAYLKEQGIEVDLVYIDPPFASGADYAKKVYIRRNPKVAEAIVKAEEELDIDELKAFEEKMYGDVWQKERYLNWMWENLIAIKSVMSETASIYVHLDWHIGHYVKILLDEIFGEDNFKREIIWQRTAGHDLSSSNFDTVIDSIYFYSKSDEYVFNQQYQTLSQEEMNEKFPLIEEFSGRRFNHEKLEKSSNSYSAGEKRVINGQEIVSNVGWIWTQDTFNQRLKENPNIIFWTETGRPRYKNYADEYLGRKINNLWIDINPLSSTSNERCNYVTQKPEALLERIIKTSSNKASSNENTIVADFLAAVV